MKIFYERSGGFGGFHIQRLLDSNKLPQEEAHRLEQNLAAAKFFDLPKKLTSPAGDADRFQYKITVETPDKEHTVEFGEAAADEALQSLVQQLNNLARSSAGSQP